MAKEKSKAEKQSFFSGINRRIREMRSEAKKVVWPTPQKLLHDTGIVIAMVIVFGVFIWGTDALMSVLTNLILGA